MFSRRRPNHTGPIFYPPLAARYVGDELPAAGHKWWVLVSVLLFIPLTAALHHLIFLPQHCMLAIFGDDYDPATVAVWLTRDPSLPWALLGSAATYWLGLRSKNIRLLAAPVFVSFLPVSLYIWDLPFTRHVICRLYHDGRLVLFGTTSLRTAHLYVLGICTWSVLSGSLLLARRRLEMRDARRASQSTKRPRLPVPLHEPSWIAGTGRAQQPPV